MRKAEVLKHEPKVPDPEAKRQIGRNHVYGGDGKRYLNLEATASTFHDKAGHQILEIDLWDGSKLKARYFADGEAGSHCSFIPDPGVWKKFNINNTAGYVLGKNTGNGGYWCGAMGWNYYSDEDLEITDRYIKPYAGTAYSDKLLYWETSIMAKRREKQMANKQARIDTFMAAAVPDSPQGFDAWANSLIPQNYVFQEKTDKGVECNCSACREMWIQPKGIGTKKRACPKCGAEVIGTYKKAIATSGNNKRRSGKKIILMQPCRDNGGMTLLHGFPVPKRKKWLIRIFCIDAEWDSVNGKYTWYTEGIRIFLNEGDDLGICFYLKWINREGYEEWGNSNPANWRFGKGYVYPGTLDEVMPLWNDAQKRVGIRELALRGECFNANAMIIHARTRPAWEYLIKGGFIRLALEEINICGTYSGYTYVNHKGKTAKQVLELNGDNINRLRQMNGGYIAKSWLRYGQTMGISISRETIQKYEKHGYTKDAMWKLLAYVRSPARLINYLEKQAAGAGKPVYWVMNEYMDYLDMAQKQKLDLKKDLFLMPKDLIRAHDECVIFAKSHEIELKADGIREKFPKVEAVMKEIREKYSFESGNFVIIVPKKVEDIIKEGRILGHCIDTTDRYFDRIQQHISYLVFLRRAEDPEKPWYTLEIEPGGTVRQQRTTGNNQNKKDAEEYMPFIREWQKAVRQRITEADRVLAEKSKDTRIREYKELRDKKEKVWHGILAGKLLADVLESDLIEEVG